MRKWWMFAVLLLMTLIAGPAAARGSPEEECFMKGGVWDAAAQECRLIAQIEIDINYPMLITPYDFAEQAVDEFLRAERAAFLEPLTMTEFFSSPGPLTLYIDYEQYQYSDSVFTLNFTVGTYTGGAHPNSYFRSFTFDVMQQRVLALEDLFLPGTDALATIFPIVQQSLQARLGDMTDTAWLESGTGLNPANYQNFALTPDALIFFFSPYQVAAYAAGPQTVTIPLAQLAGLLALPASSGAIG